MKVGNAIFTALGFVVLICNILNILNRIVGNFQYQIFAAAYLQIPEIPVIAIALIAIGLGMIIKGIEDSKTVKTPMKA